MPLCGALTKSSENQLLSNILMAIKRLMCLDQTFNNELVGIESVCFNMEAVDGFNQVQSLTEHPN